jgi:hypothetical protein
MFGINPSDLQWWMWLLVALGAAFLAITSFSFAVKRNKVIYLSIALFYLFGFVALVSIFIGIIRFIKWVWEG